MTKCGIYTCLNEIDEEDEDDVNGLTGNWYFNEDTEDGKALYDEWCEIRFRIADNEDTDEDEERRQEIADILDKDLTKIIGYPVTIRDGDFIMFDNEEIPGEWYKKSS